MSEPMSKCSKGDGSPQITRWEGLRTACVSDRTGCYAVVISNPNSRQFVTTEVLFPAPGVFITGQ